MRKVGPRCGVRVNVMLMPSRCRLWPERRSAPPLPAYSFSTHVNRDASEALL